MDLWQCLGIPTEERVDPPQPSRLVRSEDRDIRPKPPAVPADMRSRRQSLPSGSMIPPASKSAHSTLPGRTRHLSSRSSRSNTNSNEIKHWGSQLSLRSENSVHELRSRTLRPPSPETLRRSRCNTPSRGRSTTPKPVIPDTKITEAVAPTLDDYLKKPRVVSTFQHGINPQPNPPNPSEFHAKRWANYERPPYRNLRLGYFLEGPDGGDSEIIPEILREYYRDTYLTNRLWP